IDGEMACGGRDEVLRAIAVGRRIQSEKASALFAPSVLGNPVAGEGSSSQRIAYGCRDRTKIAASERERWRRRETCFLLTAALPFVSDEEKRFVFLDGSAKHATELVTTE